MRRLPVALVCLAMSVVAEAASVRIQSVETRKSGVITITAGAETCELRFGSKEAPSCTLTVPPGTKVVTVRDGARVQEVKVVDVDPVLAPLRDRSKPFGARIQAFLAARAKLGSTWPALGDAGAHVSARDGHSREEIELAEQRLGFNLPREYAEMLQVAGAVQIDDSAFTTPDELTNAYDQMIQQWETPKPEIDGLPAGIVRLLRESTILFTEVGDGYGALLYQPKSAQCTTAGAFLYTHQDEIAVAPPRVGCDFTEAAVWLMQRFVLEAYDGVDSDYLLIDSGNAGFTTELVPWGESLKFTARW
jgi:hypothetical protein